MFSSDDFMVVWNGYPREQRNVAVVSWPDYKQLGDGYLASTGNCDRHFHEAPDDEKILMLLALFVDLTIGDGIDPKAIESEFMKINIWRDMRINLPSGSYKAYLEDGTWSPHNA